ncbi:hypothetical protein AC1031_014865 [Aphanomyces cochlioides]|nr:hypothetical protein AC1031_014865 [Aphanomyces cochlioides]
MNPLLLLYLNLVRGPQLDAARRKKEEEERLAREAANPDGNKKADAKKDAKPAPPPLASCKKCDNKVDQDEVDANFGLCVQCASNPWSLVTPSVIFQLAGILLALAVLVYRFMNGLPLI